MHPFAFKRAAGLKYSQLSGECSLLLSKSVLKASSDFFVKHNLNDIETDSAEVYACTAHSRANIKYFYVHSLGMVVADVAVNMSTLSVLHWLLELCEFELC